MSWTTDPGDAPAGDVEPTVHHEATSVEAAPAVDEAVVDPPVEDESSADVVTGETDAASPDDAAVEDAAPEPVEPPREPDERLLAAHDLALSALREVTPEATIGAPAGYTLEDGGVVSLLFENQMSGYPGWFWTVTLARLEDEEPTVLELELLPGADALLAPEWVPWAVRLADYQAAQAALREAGEVDADEDADESDDEGLDLDDLDDLDAVDFDRDGSPILHAGDVDGVDIDELAESSEIDEDADEGFDDDSDDDDSDVDDSDFVDDESDEDDESDDSEDGDSDEDDDESDEDDDESHDDDDSEDDAAHGFEFEIERDQN